MRKKYISSNGLEIIAIQPNGLPNNILKEIIQNNLFTSITFKDNSHKNVRKLDSTWTRLEEKRNPKQYLLNKKKAMISIIKLK